MKSLDCTRIWEFQVGTKQTVSHFLNNSHSERRYLKQNWLFHTYAVNFLLNAH